MPARDRTRCGLSAIEVAALGLVIAGITFTITNAVNRQQMEPHLLFSGPALNEVKPLRRYGPEKFSRHFEEWIVRDYFKDRREGVFLDVGSYHYKDESNTYYLETALGWSGVAIDAVEEFGPDYKAHRPRTKFVAIFASDVPNSKVQFFVPKDNKLIASSSREFTERYGEAVAPREVPTTTLNVVMDQAGIKRLDFMSMDIELSEPKALEGFDIDRFQPALVCIEAHPDVRQPILEYFSNHRYIVVGKYLRSDPYNLYFQPSAQQDKSQDK